MWLGKNNDQNPTNKPTWLTKQITKLYSRNKVVCLRFNLKLAQNKCVVYIFHFACVVTNFILFSFFLFFFNLYSYLFYNNTWSKMYHKLNSCHNVKQNSRKALSTSIPAQSCCKVACCQFWLCTCVNLL